MKRNKVFYRAILGILILISTNNAVYAREGQYESNPTFLITPLIKAPAVISPGQVVSAEYTIQNNPKNKFALYRNGVVDLPKGVTVSGGSCSRPTFDLNPGASCTVVLQITADELVSDIHHGPGVCNSLQHCVHHSRPSAGNELNVVIIKSSNSLSITGGQTMTLYTNDLTAEGWMVVKNNSSTLTAVNIAANFSPTALNGSISQDASNCTSVAPGASCTLYFTITGTTDIPATNFSVSGSNTPPVTGTLAISTVNPGQSVGDSLNGGKIASLNVTPSGSGACGTTATTLYLVAATEDPSNPLPWDSNPSCDSISCTQTNATDTTDGATNTSTIVSVLTGQPGVTPTNYLAGFCFNYEVDASGNAPCQSGVCYKGWYLPAQTELYCLYNNQSLVGGFSTGVYPSSSEIDATNVWYQIFSNGNQISLAKYPLSSFRCVRAITN